MLALKALAGWLLILVCAVANGMLREFVLVPVLGAAPGLVVSGVLLCALILVVALLLTPWFGPGRWPSRAGVGLLWLGLTVAFEFGLGLAQGKSWPELWAPYTFEDANLWPAVLIVTAVAPVLAARLRDDG